MSAPPEDSGPPAPGPERALRLGTRASALALAQSGMMAEALTAATGRPVELVHVTTYGDTSRESLSVIGGTGVFVNALRDALYAGEIDFAVHSLKDLPTAAPEGLHLAAVSERAAVNDALVARDGLKLADLPAGARVGTGAARRMALLKMIRPDLEVVPIRGNVDTRVNFVRSGRLDAVLVAFAGLQRLGRDDEATEVLDPEIMLPSPGQGALAVECRDADLVGLLAVLDHGPTRAAVVAERTMLAVLEAGCSAPVGGHAIALDDNVLSLTGVVATVTGSRGLRLSATGTVPDAEGLGRRVAEGLLAEGAAEIMEAGQ
ncbi:hydroxymethylbilane synthase [Catenulispora sp. NF23]|uniref:Porphobilinogen deaminase n=1 Tax=Catenulispora pinistramenti TaxID=2705254 RepID=A0ABS5KPR9_9ACTN|nr:hydroxymethylbilane synthase [Catenulispora pinistramenti]MBS2535572.1 hydroxymethylbilane synthase [Catenulispora pinistramenti]MBS2548040.1 hydroxymethylbilane synthase [Catenulispora pinistramenti]